MRQMLAQLRAKCESAPLRRSVTERAMRSTPNAFGSTLTAVIVKVTKHTKNCAFYRCDRLTYTYSAIRSVAPQEQGREAPRRASPHARAG